MSIGVGDEVIAGGMPATVLAVKTVGTQIMYECLVEVPQVRWFPAAQVSDGTTPPPPPAPAPVPAAHVVPMPPPPPGRK